MDLGRFLVQDHLAGQPAHLAEVCRYRRQAAQHDFIQFKLVVGDDADVPSDRQVLRLDLPGQAGQAGIQLRIEDQEGISAGNLCRGFRHVFYGNAIFGAETSDSFADQATIQGGGQLDDLQAAGRLEAVQTLG